MKWLFLISMLFTISIGTSQVKVDSLPSLNTNPRKVTCSPPDLSNEQAPEYPGGQEALFNELYTYISYPKEAKEAGITGTVYVDFIVDSTGNTTDIKILKGIGGGCDEQVLQAFNRLEHCWLPGFDYKGKPKNFRFRLPLRFVLD